MQVTIGTYTLASGTAGGQPSRLLNAVGTANVQVSRPIRATNARLYPRGNRLYTDVIEADYTYATPALAQAAIPTLRSAALAASGALAYNSTTIAPTAYCTQAELIHWTGCGITMQYEILSVQET